MYRFTNIGKWLDIGSGNGNLAVELLKSGWEGSYLGIDFSDELVQIARKKTSTLFSKSKMEVQFITADIFDADWITKLPDINWEGAAMFAVLHHIPGHLKRKEILHSIRRFLPVGSPLYLSVWQLQNSSRLLKRIQPWEKIGMDESQVEAGDVLMDWRASTLDEVDNFGYRYVHLFSEKELDDLAEESGFRVMDRYYSDGKEGNLALYEEWA